MSYFTRTIGFSAFTLLLVGGSIVQSVADPAKSIPLITDEEQQQHIEIMKDMTHAQRMQYRNEQYAHLRKKAASIGYDMPESPPWATAEADQPGTDKAPSTAGASPATATEPAKLESSTFIVEPIGTRHEDQLAKYRRAAAEKRQAMEERLEKQRQSVKERISKLVEENAVKSAPERLPRLAPPPRPAAPTYPQYGPSYPQYGPAYPPRYYAVPPPVPYYY